MTNQDALRILDTVCSQVPLTRQQHIEVQQAVATLALLVNPVVQGETETIKFPQPK